jgi:F0F1-type ATP synthase membrane subunit b/b'
MRQVQEQQATKSSAASTTMLMSLVENQDKRMQELEAQQAKYVQQLEQHQYDAAAARSSTQQEAASARGNMQRELEAVVEERLKGAQQESALALSVVKKQVKVCLGDGW